MSINAQPFNPTFKLIGNLLEDQVLTYDSSENAFVNTANTGGGGASGYTAVANQGTGTAIYYGDAGATLQLKTLIGGSDITITDNGTGGVILASTSTDTIQTATNLGTGTGLFDSKDATTHALKFKSIIAGAGLTLTDDGAGTLTLVNDVASGTTDADLTLSNLSSVGTARTNLDVHSKAESDALYHKHDGHFIPDATNTYDIGSSLSKYNDVYAETFHGTAVLSDNLTTSGTTGQVLTYNGSTWAAADTSGGTLLGLADVSTVVPADGQHLVWNTTTSLWTPSAPTTGGGGYSDTDARNSISVSGDLTYNSATGVISYTTPTDTDTTYTAGTGLTLTGTVFSNTSPDQTVALTGAGATSITGTYPNFTITSTDTDTNTTYTNVSEFTNDSGYLTSVPAQAWSTITGTPTTIAGYGITDRYANAEVDGHLNTSTATANQVLKWTGTDYAWVTSTDSDTTYTAGSGLTLTGTVFSMTGAHFDGTWASLTGAPTTVSSFTNDANYLSSVPAQAFSSLIDVLPAGAPEDNMVLYYDHANTLFKWKTDATTPAGYNNTNWDTAFGWGDHSTAGYLTSTTAHYTDSDVNTHLNTGTATANQALVWTGTDYDWVTSTDSDTTYTAGANLSLTGTVFANTSPDQTVVLTGTGATSITGTYPNFTINSTDTNTDTDTTYTAGSGLTLTGTAFSLSAAHFDGAYASLTGAPTMYANSNVDGHLNTSTATANQVLTWTGTDYDWISSGAHFDGNYSSLVGAPTTVSSFTNDAGYLTAQTDSQTLSLSGTTLAITGGNNVDLGVLTIDDMADVNITSVADNQFLKYDNASGDWLNETVTIPTLTSQLTNDAGFLTSETAHYADANVDTHLNTGSATNNQILSWTGTDYDWVTSTDSDTTYTAGTGLTLAGTVFSNTSPDQTVALTGTGATTVTGTYPNFTINSTDTDTNTIYANSDVDLHLNKGGSVTSGYILSWNGSDYNWIANSGTPAWSAITNKPTTISGFGITDTFFDGAYASLTGAPTIPSGTQIIDWTSASAGTIHASNYTDTNTTYTAGSGITLSGGAFINASPDQTVALTGAGATSITGTYPNFTITSTDTNTDTNTTYTAGSGLTLTGTAFSLTDAHFSGVYADLTSKPTIPSALTDLSISDGTNGQVLTTNGAGAFTFTTVSGGGGGATDKIEEGNSSVEVIDGGANGHVMFNTNGTDRWQVTAGGHILPEATETYDLGSADKKVRHLFLSDNSLYIEDNTIKTSGTNLLFNDDDVMDYTNLKNKPDAVASGTGIQVNSGNVSLNATLSMLTDVHTATPTDGQVLKWDNGNSRWAPGTDLTSDSSAMNDLSDVDTSGISTGQYLKWDGSNFVASTVTAGASSIDALTDVDTTTSAPSNGDVLTWNTTDSEWAPSAPAAGGGSGATIEMFKLNYDSAGNLDTITNTTSGVSATILSTTGGNTVVTFTGHNYPPSSILIYGYVWGTNEYKVEPFSKDMTTRTVSGGGSAGSPTAFGSMSSVDLTLNLHRSNTGAATSFGTVTHAWIMFTMV